ncbi:MAG: hypothetical protein Q7J82_00565 [Coriobacteriia bacterium]|nr:hypothetical protein [Coriobacteriia bacterium]
MIEEVTTLNIQSLIDKIPVNSDERYRLSPLEKVILCNDGTVQTLLSVLFGVPIKVEVLHQEDLGLYILRQSQLIAEYAPDNIIQVCWAESMISKSGNPEGFITGIMERGMGIGQLITALGINTRRELKAMSCGRELFTRSYKIYNVGEKQPNIDIMITEIFSRGVYKKLE